MDRLYDYLDSGNGFKVRLLASLLGVPLEVVPLDITRGETKTPDFLAKNPQGKIPLLETGDGNYLPESNAILVYLAEGSRYYPSDRLARAEVLAWLFFEQNSHEPFVATARFIARHTAPNSPRRAELFARIAEGRRALGILEQRLENHPYLVRDEVTLADVALYAYTHVAPEGGLSLDEFPALRRWIRRLETEAGFVPLARFSTDPPTKNF